jgi:response regulator RpfG family c-di-GMP phosphodiesterase
VVFAPDVPAAAAKSRAPAAFIARAAAFSPARYGACRVSPAAARGGAAEVADVGNREKLSILYFDDEPACLSVFSETFAAEHEVRTAATLAEARRALAENSFDVVISDQFMPEISGAAFLREIARTHPRSLRVMVTGGASVGSMLGEIGDGVVRHFVPKPWSEATMRQVFERASFGE